MFNVRRDEDWPGFSVGLPENPPGFRVADDGSPLSTLVPRPTPPSFQPDVNIAVPAGMSDLLLKTGGPIESRAMTAPQDRFVGNPYWRGESDSGRISPIVPTGYGFPRAPTGLLAPEAMQTTTPLQSDLPQDVGEQGVRSATAAIASGSPNGIDSTQSPVMVQYTPDNAPPPIPPVRRQGPAVDASPGEVVVLPDGSKIVDAKSSTGYVMSPKADLHDVAAKGRQIGEVYRSILANPATSPGAYLYLFAALGLNVGQAGSYDHQRRGNMVTGYTQLPQFRPIANVNVGLLAQQAGLTLEQALDIAGTYAQLRSSNADPKAPYGLDPRTLHYIQRGYEIGQSGLFDRPPRR